MSLYKELVVNGGKIKTPKSIDKLMGKKSWDIAGRKKDALAENPGSYVISWMEVLSCAWSYMKTHWETNGIFPPSIIIDHKHTPQNEYYRTGAQINTAWRVWRNSAGDATQIFPSYMELRVYHKNIMQMVYDKFGHTLPETAMIAYMTNTGIHEFIHFLNYYDQSKDVDTAFWGEENYMDSVKKMDEFVFSRDTAKDEYETERDAIISTLQYMRYCYGDQVNTTLEAIPGGPYDLFCREKFGGGYRMASLMCEYLWQDLRQDFEEGCDLNELQKYKRKLVHEFSKFTTKHPTKMIIID